MYRFGVTGTLIWYYYVCIREVWLMAHQLTPDPDNELLELGRLISQQSFRSEKKEIRVGEIVIDLIKDGEGGVIVGEVKKSSKYLESAKMQLAFYLEKLKRYGIDARGELLFPKEKKRVFIDLDYETSMELRKAELNIYNIVVASIPPLPIRVKYCKNCAYSEFCWC